MRWTGPSVLAFVLVVVLTTSHGAEAGPQTSHRGTLRRALTNSSAVVPDKQQDPACPTDGVRKPTGRQGVGTFTYLVGD